MEYNYILIKQTITYVPVNGKLFKRTEILEEVVKVPTIDLTYQNEPAIRGDKETSSKSSERHQSGST